MNEPCVICTGKALPSNREVAECIHCGSSIHKECFKKKYNGNSAVPGPDFVCINCLNSGKGATTSNGKNDKRPRNDAGESDDEKSNKRARSNSRGRPPKGKNDDILKFLGEFRAEMMQSMNDNTDRIQKTVSEQMAAFRVELTEVKRENAEIVKSVEFMSEKYDEMQKGVEQCNQAVDDAKLDIGCLKTLSSESSARLDKLEAELNLQAQAAVRNNLVITGLSKTEKPADTFWQLVSSMKAKTVQSDVASVELLKKFEAKDQQATSKATANGTFSSDTILVRFNSNEAKADLIKAKKELGVAFADQVQGLVARSTTHHPGAKPRVLFFRDHLTEFSMKLFEAAKNKQAQLGYRFLWTKNGQILMRQADRGNVHRIRSIGDLDKLPPTRS